MARFAQEMPETKARGRIHLATPASMCARRLRAAGPGGKYCSHVPEDRIDVFVVLQPNYVRSSLIDFIDNGGVHQWNI